MSPRPTFDASERGDCQVFCVTVDPTGPSYLPRMYGDVAYTVIDRVDQLPERLVRLVRRLTS